jgi:hypothetical protein
VCPEVLLGLLGEDLVGHRIPDQACQPEAVRLIVQERPHLFHQVVVAVLRRHDGVAHLRDRRQVGAFQRVMPDHEVGRVQGDDGDQLPGPVQADDLLGIIQVARVVRVPVHRRDEAGHPRRVVWAQTTEDVFGHR